MALGRLFGRIRLKHRKGGRQHNLPIQTGDYLIGMFLLLNVNYLRLRYVVRIVILRILRHEGPAVGGSKARGYGRLTPESLGLIMIP